MASAAHAISLDMPPAATAWLPGGKRAAICFSIDDVHPGTSADAYEAGGDLGAGALGRLQRLQQRHPLLQASLCVTPDWRLDSLVPDTKLWRHVPGLAQRVHWTRLHPPGHFRLDRHPAFVRFLRQMERCELVPHGLHHAHEGSRFAVEYQDQDVAQCLQSVRESLSIFDAAGLRHARGFAPPAWNAPPALVEALEQLGFTFLFSARDVATPITPAVEAGMSGLRGVSLLQPQSLGRSGLVHLPCNFQATCAPERAFAIVEAGGLLHIKAHVFKSGGGHVMQDGLDELYCNYLDLLFRDLHQRYGASLWWAQPSEVAQRVRALPP